MGVEILIIKLGAIGDVLRTTSVLQGLKEKYPESNITWMTRENASELLVNNPFIGKVLTIESGRPQLKARYDLIINLDEDEEACIITSGLQGKIIGFFCANGLVMPTKTAQQWFNMSMLGPRPQNNVLKKENSKTYQQHMLDILSISPKAFDTILHLTDEELECGKKFAKDNGINEGDLVIGLNTGAGQRWEKKRLSVEKTAELAKKLHDELGAKIILLGGPEEKERNKAIRHLISFDVIDSGDHSLRHFASIVNLCKAVVTSDSLCMHIAVALKRPVCVFFGPTSSAEIELYGRGKKVVAAIDCVCCYRKQCDKTPSCMDMITVDELFAAVKGLLS